MAGRFTSEKVFINCPFDKEYRPLFQCMIFTLLYLDLEPVFSYPTSSDHIRILKIMNLIERSRLSIHDISRSRAKTAGEIARFNMPFELGLAVGCRRFGGRKYQHKKLLILDAEKNLYDRSIGDISGQDIEAHNNDPAQVMEAIRDWYDSLFPKRFTKASILIWNAYNQFKASSNYVKHKVENQKMNEFRKSAMRWLKLNNKL